MKDDKTLRCVLQSKIALINSPKLPSTIFDEVKATMYNKFNVKSDRTVDIFNGFEPIETLPYHMLYKLMTSIKEVGAKCGDFDTSELNEQLYFNENEVTNNEYDKKIPDKEEDFDIVIKDWHQTNVGMYSYITIHTDINEVIKWRDYNKLRFNPETQRDLVVVETNGVPISKLDINEKAILEMQELMYNGSYFPVAGALNINPELYDEYPFEIKGSSLVINRRFKIDLVEGFHNYLAYTGVKDKNKDWNYPCEFRLYLMNVDDANRYILQMDKKNHFKVSQTTRIDSLSPYNYFITNLNNSSKFSLRGTIDNEMFLNLFKILPKIIQIGNIPDAARTISQIMPMLNYVVMHTDHFDVPFDKSEWFAYLYLAKKSIEKKLDFEKLIVNVDINSLFSEIKIKNEPLNRHYRVLNNIIEEWMSNV